MQFPPRFLDEIRARLVLSEVIGRKVPLTRAGREFKGCCAFHQEKSPSFYVNDEKQFYHCFGCGAHGDVIGWTMNYENRSFPEAIEQLAAAAGLEMPRPSPEAVRQANKEKDLYQLTRDAAEFFEAQLYEPANRTSLDYISQRGLSDETLRAFHIGCAPSDRQALHRHLKAKGYKDAQMAEAGLIRMDKRGEPYSFFRERVMFPVTDRRGRIVAFGGRILPSHLRAPDQADFKPPKYINSSDTPLFHKGRMLYGEAHAAFAAREDAPLIVVEGYLDVIACWQAGFKGAVAPLGTALTEDQIAVLWRMSQAEIKKPVLCFDGDAAGRRAAERGVMRILPLLKAGHSAEIVFLPEGEDPDTLIRANGAKAFQAHLDKALSLVDFLWQMETEGRRLDTPEERAALAARLEAHAALIPDKDVQYHYKTDFRAKMRGLLQPVYQRPNKPARTGKKPAFPDPVIVPLSYAPSRPDEIIHRILLCGVVTHPEIFDDIEERLGLLNLSHPHLLALRKGLFSILGAEINLDFESLKSQLISVGLERELSYTVNDSVFTHNGYIRPNVETHIVLENWNRLWEDLARDAGRAGYISQ